MFGLFEGILEEGRTAREQGHPYDDWTPDLVVVSGDVGYSGSHDDYIVAKGFFEKLLDQLDLGPDRIVMCPGNHDRDWRRGPETEGAETPYPKSSGESDRLLSVETLTWTPGEKVSPLVQPFLEFQRFCEELGAMRPEGIPGLEYLTGTCRAEVGDLPVEFLVVNSAWFSVPKTRGGADPQNMWIGLPLLEHLGVTPRAELLEHHPDCLYIGLCHHPLDWLNPAEFYGVEGRPPAYGNLTQNCHALVSGHVHSPLEPPSRMHNYAQVFTGGAVYTRDEHIVSSNLSLLKFDLDDHSVGRRGFEYKSERTIWEELKASQGTYHLHNNDTVAPPTMEEVSLEGEWETVVWQDLKPSVRKQVKSINLSLVKKKADGSVRYRSSDSDEVMVRGELRAGYFSGYWEEEGEKRFGTFQVKVREGGELLTGRWVGFDADNRIQSGHYRFKRGR